MKKPRLNLISQYPGYVTSGISSIITLEIFTPKARRIVEETVEWMRSYPMLYDEEYDLLNRIMQNPDMISNTLKEASDLYCNYTGIHPTGEVYLTFNNLTSSGETPRTVNQVDVEKYLAKWIAQLRAGMNTDEDCRERIRSDCTLKDMKMLEEWFKDKKKAIKKYGVYLDQIVGHELDPVMCSEMCNAMEALKTKLQYITTLKNIGGFTYDGYLMDLEQDMKKMEAIHEHCIPVRCAVS